MLCLGIDVGATKVAAGLVEVSSGEVVQRGRLPTARDPDEVLRDCVGLGRELHRDGVEGVGVAVCELVRPDGSVASAETIDWRGVDVASAFDGVAPAVVESDVRAAALAEARLGAGRGRASMLFVNVGSGISHTLVVEGRPLAGARGNAIISGAPPVEEWASGLALARAAGTDTAEDVLRDPAHAGLVADAAQRLGRTLAALVNALDPAVVVMGGGLGSHERYRRMVAEAVRPLVYAEETREVEILPAALGADAGIVGAAIAAANA
jgi:glucokinase